MKNKDAQRRASRKYQQKHIKQFKVDLNISTDADIISHLDTKPNKSHYVKTLIRNDIKENK